MVWNDLLSQLIKNKFMTGKSSFILTSMENMLSEIGIMYEIFTKRQNASRNSWDKLKQVANKLVHDIQNLNTVFKFESDSWYRKDEIFSITDVFKEIYGKLFMSWINNECQLELAFEEGIPEVVYGDMTKFKQLIFIILNYSVAEQVNDVPTTAFVRFAELDSFRRYVIECKFEIYHWHSIELVLSY